MTATTALPSHQTMDFKALALQAQQLKDNAGAAVNMTTLTALGNSAQSGGASKTLTAADAGGRSIFFDTASGTVFTLPPATGSGLRWKFVCKVVATSGTNEIAGDNVGTFYGCMEVDKAGTVTNYTSAGSNKALKFLFGGTQGLNAIGDMIEVVDVDTNKYGVLGFTQGAGTLATPFSATV